MGTGIGIGAVIFDFNGVLVDDESVHCALFQEVLAQEEVTITERDYHERYLGYDDRGCFDAALKDAGQQVDRARLDDLIARKARRYVEVAERGLRFFPAAAETLRAIAARWPVAINSGALRPEIEYALRRLGCLDRVAAIISAEDTDKCKPDPEGYRLAFEALRARGRADRNGDATERLSPSACLVIEDSLAGIASAKGAGMRAVGVSTTYDADQLREAGADDVVETLAAFTPEWIERRFCPLVRRP
jgi:beta-phosphoglucomutase-like phosphatase (HAD superfamily)